MTAKHPARFTGCVLDTIAELLPVYLPPDARVLDPFAGTGRVHELPFNTIGVEIEPDWADTTKGTCVGNALDLPFADFTFDAIVTSPCYGNRFADHHNAADASLRRSYTHDIGHKLHPCNAGTLHWGPDYREFHRDAWREIVRVLKPEAPLVLNISDHVRKRMRQRVAGWHVNTIERLGLRVIDIVPVVTPRTRYGENADARVDAELIVVMS